MLATTHHWFSECCTDCGTAFSLTIHDKLHEEQTPFQKIAIYATETFGNLMTIDGFVMLTSRDNFLYHEMMSHPALLCHPNPQRVLIIGGGDCGTLREVLKHREVVEAVQVDIDEGVTRAALRYFPELCESNGDPRAAIHFEDGLAWIKRAEVGAYDLIIVDSTDPVGPAEGLFGVEFYRDCRRVLGESGILVHQSESPLLHGSLIQAMHQAMADAGFSQRQILPFPQPVYPSGWWSCTLATAHPDPTALQQIRGENEPLPFETLYYSCPLHRGTLATPPFLARQLAQVR